MEWTSEAEAAVKKVPFFVRKKVRQRVENEARAAGKHAVILADVKATRKRYLASMAAEVKGYQLDACFGPSGCPNRAMHAESLVVRLEKLLGNADLRSFLEARVMGDLKFHHEFRVTVAECPNACSQPQIKDVGIIGAHAPAISDEPCTQCSLCVEVCPDGAIALNEAGAPPDIDRNRCMACGKCIPGCPTGTLTDGRRGYRVFLGGRLGRHPRLAVELGGIYTEDEVLDIVARCIAYYKENSTGGRRFAQIFNPADLDRFLPPPYARKN
jgi:anaerobic sulfite reductase subunit C